MRNVLVCTVGTSLKGNIERTSDSNLKKLLTEKNVKGLALALKDIDPLDRLMGAEINSIAGILKKSLLKERIYLYLLVSDTSDGEYIGNVLQRYYGQVSAHGFEKTTAIRIQGLSDESPRRFQNEGLRNLVKAMAEIVRRHGSQSVLINATGGYKAQISFAGMIGQALEIPVCYLFERFSEVIELPPQPISMDMGFWLSNASLFFELAGDGVETNPVEIDARFSSLVETVVEGEKLLGLSAIGQLFHETFQYRFQRQRETLLPPDSGLPPEDKTIKYEDKNKGKHRGIDTYLKKICQRPYVTRIYTHYYNPGLPQKIGFRPSTVGDLSQVEGIYSDGKATTKFDIVTTARTEDQRHALLVDLRDLTNQN